MVTLRIGKRKVGRQALSSLPFGRLEAANSSVIRPVALIQSSQAIS